MKNMVLRIITLMLITVISVAQFQNVKADNDNGAREIGIECVGNYSTWNDLDDLGSPLNIADDFAEAFSNNNKKWKVSYNFKNNVVWETDFRGASLGGRDSTYADNVDLLIYSGHGLKPKGHGSDDYAFALNSKQKSKYAKQSEMYLGNRDLEWLVTFTCNFLASKDLNKIGHMAKGIHAICGFETTVILTADMGSVFAKKLKKGYSVKEAFFGTAKDTRIWYKSGGTAGVFTTTKNEKDRIWGYGTTASDPKNYSKNKSGYILYSYKY